MDVQAEIDALNAEKATILATLASLADVVDMSSQGRSVNASGTRRSLQDRLKDVNERLAVLQPFELSEVRRG